MFALFMNGFLMFNIFVSDNYGTIQHSVLTCSTVVLVLWSKRLSTITGIIVFIVGESFVGYQSFFIRKGFQYLNGDEYIFYETIFLMMGQFIIRDLLLENWHRFIFTIISIVIEMWFVKPLNPSQWIVFIIYHLMSITLFNTQRRFIKHEDDGEQLLKIFSILHEERVVLFSKDFKTVFFRHHSFGIEIDLKSLLDSIQVETTESNQKLSLLSYLSKPKIATEISHYCSDCRRIHQLHILTVNIKGQNSVLLHFEKCGNQTPKRNSEINPIPDVLATICHELRSPINGILGILQIIPEEFPDRKLGIYCQNIKVCSKMLLNLANSILDFTQLRNNCLKLVKRPFKSLELLADLQSLFGLQIKNKGIDFIIRVEHTFPKVIYTDKNRLLQILINLLSNALKFTIEGEIILDFNYNKEKNELKFSVQDTGIGIPNDQTTKLGHIFGKLPQANDLINPDGVGLGLNISNQLLKVLDTNPDKHLEFETIFGKGTKFWFTISEFESSHSLIYISQDEECKSPSKSPLLDEVRSASASGSGTGSGSGSGSGDFSADYSETMAEQQEQEQGHGQGHGQALCQLTNSQILTDKFSPSKCQIPILKYANPYLFSTEPSSSKLSIPARGGTKKSELSLNFDDKRIDHVLYFKYRALIVDDDSLNLLILSNLLRKRNFHVTSALNGNIALERIKQQSKTDFFDIIFMDLEMPILNGYKTTEILNTMMKNHEIPDIPIITLTSMTPSSKRQTQPNSFFSKPLQPQDLQYILTKFIQTKSGA